jgi:hypothetical protein
MQNDRGVAELLLSPRWPELEAYAERTRISYARAVVIMVNRGLSYTED